MANLKTTQYPTTATTLNAVDLFDVSVRISTSPDVWESQKIPYATVRTLMTNTLSEVLAADNETNGHNIIVTGGDLIQSTVAGNYIDLAKDATDVELVSAELLYLTGNYVQITGTAITLTGDTDAPANNISAVALKVKGTGGNGYLGLKHQSAAVTVSANESGLYANSSGNPLWKNDGNPVVELASIDYVNSVVVGLWDDRGNYDASGNVFPSSGGSGTAGAILKGDIWTISVAGTLGGQAVVAGDTVRALQDSPTLAAHWNISETNLGYTPITNVLNSGEIIVGNSSNVATARTATLNASGGTFGISNLGVFTFPDAATGTRGLLTPTDWNTFNNKNSSAVNDTFFSGQWHYPIGSGARRAITGLSGIIWLIPYYIGRDRTVTDIGANLSAGVAAGNIRLALYSADGTGGGPKTLIEDSGNITATSSGFKSFTFASSKNLSASNKLYWLGLQTSSGTIGVYYTQMISAILDQAQNANTSMRVLSQVFGAFPADVSACVFNTSVLNFQIGLKIA